MSMRTQLLFGLGVASAAAVASILSHFRFAPAFAIVSRCRPPSPRRKFLEYEFGHDSNATIAVLFVHRIGRQNDYLQTLHRHRQRVRGHERRMHERGGKKRAQPREKRVETNTIGEKSEQSDKGKNVQKRSTLSARRPESRIARRKSLKHASCSLLRSLASRAYLTKVETIFVRFSSLMQFFLSFRFLLLYFVCSRLSEIFNLRQHNASAAE